MTGWVPGSWPGNGITGVDEATERVVIVDVPSRMLNSRGSHPIGRRTDSALARLPRTYLARTGVGALLEGWACARSLGTRPA